MASSSRCGREAKTGSFAPKTQGPRSPDDQVQQRLGTVSIADKDRRVNQALRRYLELEAMIPVAEAMARGAIERRESRGSHTRTDYPSRDDRNYLHHTIAAMKKGTITISSAPVTLGMFIPKERVY